MPRALEGGSFAGRRISCLIDCVAEGLVIGAPLGEAKGLVGVGQISGYAFAVVWLRTGREFAPASQPGGSEAGTPLPRLLCELSHTTSTAP